MNRRPVERGRIEPYLFFDGRCEEAIDFYRKALGAEVVTMMRFADAPEPPDPAACPGGAVPPGDKIMHAEIRIDGARLMMSDGMAAGDPSFKGVSLSLPAADETAARKAFDALADGGTVVMPLGKTFWSPAFGMVNDRFGVSWMVNVEAAAP